MICISVTPQSRRLAKVDLLNAGRYCDIIELCIDHMIKEPDFVDLLDGIPRPVIISCRRKEDGGKFEGTEEERMMLLRQAIVSAPAYIEIEADLADKIPRFGKTRRIISYNSLNKPPGKVEELYAEAVNQLKADVVKVTWRTDTLDTAWSMLAAVSKRREKPLVGLGQGQSSLMLSMLSMRYGAPWVYAALEKGMEAYPGQPTVFDLHEIYDGDSINSQTRFVGVTDFRTEEVNTVKKLNAGFRKLESGIRCLPMHFGKLDNIPKMLDFLKINALLIHPNSATQILKIADQMEEAVRMSLCADLLIKQKDGWHAFGTLWKTALRTLEQTLDPDNSAGRPLDRRNILIVGSGGLSQSIAYGVLKRKGVVSITAPDDLEAKQVAQTVGARHVAFQNLYSTLADVVVIADLGIKMGHKRDEFNPGFFKGSMTVLDLSDLNDSSPLLKEASDRGAVTIDGRELFHTHLEGLFKVVTGKDYPADVVVE